MHVAQVPAGSTHGLGAEVGKALASIALGYSVMAALASSRLSPVPAGQLQENGDSAHMKSGADQSFLLFQVTLPEHTPAGSILLTVSATDMDSGSNGEITFHLAVPSLDVAIDPSNGAWGWLLWGGSRCGLLQQLLQRKGPSCSPLIRPAVAREADQASRMPVPVANNPDHPHTLPGSMLTPYADSAFVPSQGPCSPSDRWNLMPTSPPWNWWWRPVTTAPPASRLGPRFSFRCLM